MRYSRVALLSLLGLATLALPARGENFYDYLGLVMSPPLTCDAPCEVSWRVELPGLPIGWFIKHCLGGPPIVMDRYLTLYMSGANFSGGAITLTLGDNHPGRAQMYCLRLIYLPLPPEEP